MSTVFSRLTQLVAILVVLFGIGRVMLGLSNAPSASTPGELIDKGIYTILVGLALGCLAEIGVAIGKIVKIERQSNSSGVGGG